MPLAQLHVPSGRLLLPRTPPCRFHLLKASLERGMQEGRLSIPEGVPFLVNVNDDSWCHVVVRSPALKPFMLPQAVGQRARLQQRARCIGISRLAASATLPRLLWLQEDGTSKCTAPLLSIFKSKCGAVAATLGVRHDACSLTELAFDSADYAASRKLLP